MLLNVVKCISIRFHLSSNFECLHDSTYLLLLILRIYEVGRHRHQFIRVCPISYTATLLTAPMLTILWLRQVQRLRRPIPWRKHEEHISVLTSLGRRTRRLILNDVVRTTLLSNILLNETVLGERQDGESPRRDGNVGCDPMAHLTPFRVLARGRVGVSQCDDIGWVCI